MLQIYLELTQDQSVTSWSRDFCQFFNSLGIGIEKFGLGKKVSVSKNLVSLEKSRYRKIRSRKKVSVSVSENLVLEKKITQKNWPKVARREL